MTPREVHEVPIDQLVCLPQVRERFDDEELAGLAQSIVAAGRVLVPLLVRVAGGATTVLDGERRLRAARMAGLATVPVIIEDGELSDAEVIHRQLVLDAQRVGLNSMEQARAISRLMRETSWPAVTVAAKLGVSPGHASKLLALLLLPEDVQDRVAQGRLGMSVAYELARVADPAERNRLAGEAVASGLTREQITARRQATPATPPKPRRRTGIPPDRFRLSVGNGLSVTLAGHGLSVEAVARSLAELAEQLREASGQGRTLSEVMLLVTSRAKGGANGKKNRTEVRDAVEQTK